MKRDRAYYINERSEMLQFLPNTYSRILEIGCGEGFFRKNLSLPQEYWGVEPDKESAKLAEKNLDNVLIGKYEQIESDLPENHFDLVICNDVIEHMADHEKFLNSIKTKMKENGYLIASIPNVRYIANLFYLLVNKDWQYQEDGILDKTHLRFFTKKSIQRTIRETNFSMDKLLGINPHIPKSIIMRLIYFIAPIILGSDIKYMQFGIRIKKTNLETGNVI